MFQYAAGRALSLRRGVDFCIDRRAFSEYKTHSFGMNCFKAQLKEVPQNLLPKPPGEGRIRRLLRKIVPSPLKVYRESRFNFDPHVLDLPDNSYLDGYWQSEKYFVDYVDQIRMELDVRPTPSNTNSLWLDQIAKTHSVSLHIRRGDYVSSRSAAELHGTCDLTYYLKAVDHIRDVTGIDPVVFVFSDDLDWVSANLKLRFQVNLVRDNNASTNYEDLRLMTACRHHVIANSSFSWWGAWLDGRKDSITVAPARWFLADTLEAGDIVPQRWVRL